MSSDPTDALTSAIGAVEGFEIAIPDERIQDLHERLDRTRYAPDFDNDDWKYGTPSDQVAYWVRKWRAFDWRTAEAEINRFPQYRVVIDGVPIHFLHIRGKGADPTPIVLTHGWPWTFWDWNELIDPLTDPLRYGGSSEESFDVVVPSLPGSTFSNPLTTPGIGYSETAELWLKLMRDVLGYEKFMAAGGDQGNFTSAQLGHKYPEHMLGLHLFGAIPLNLFEGEDPIGYGPNYRFEAPDTLPDDPILGDPPKFHPLHPLNRRSAHVAVQAKEPQTLAAAIHDSPAGLLSWLLVKRKWWSDNLGDVRDSYSDDFLLKTFSLYWYSDSFAPSLRFYHAMAFNPWKPSHHRSPVVEAPTAISFFDHDYLSSQSRFWCGDYYNLVRTSHVTSGGHFAPAENPAAAVSELRASRKQFRG